VEFAPLQAAVAATAAQLSGVPLERGADLGPQSQALWGGPLALASRLAAECDDDASLRSCTAALAAAEYLSKALHGYRREARAGRVPFAIEELMAAGVESADLAADTAPAALRNYLEQVRARAAGYFDTAAHALPRAERARHRHLLVLAALGLRHLSRGASPLPRGLFKDMLLAWKTARRAQF
jgi:phytoene/squalene synthetase